MIAILAPDGILTVVPFWLVARSIPGAELLHGNSTNGGNIMRNIVLSIAVLSIVALAFNSSAAEESKPKDGSDKYGFNYGG